MNLEALMGYNADLSLEFQDGRLPGNSTLLGIHSSVLRGACEAGTADAGSSGQQELVIPMPGLKKEDWMTVVPFLYPVIPRATISSWSQLEVLLKVARQLDIPLILHEADSYLSANVNSLVADQESPQNAWKWLQLADRAGVQHCIPVLGARAAAVDRAGCAELSKLQELSPHVLQQLTIVCAGHPCRPVGSKCQMQCSTYHPALSFGAPAQPIGGFPLFAAPAPPAPPVFGAPAPQVSNFTLSWVCDTCHKAQR